MVVTRLCENFEQLSFLPKQYKATAVCRCKQPTLKSFQMCLYCIDLLKLYYKLTNYSDEKNFNQYLKQNK